METKLPETTPALLYSEAYKLCAAIRALNQVAYLQAEGGAVERMKKDLEGKAHALSIDMITMWYKYDSYVRHIEETQVLARIEAGQIDHAIVKFPANVQRKPVGKMTITEGGEWTEWKGGSKSGEYDLYPRYTPALDPRMVSIPLEDAEVFHAELKERNIQQLAGGAVCMGDDMAMERRIEAAIAQVKAKVAGEALFAMRDMFAGKANGTIHENGISDADGRTRVVFDSTKPIGDPVMDPKVTRESPDNFTAAPVGQIATLTINNDTGHRVRRVNSSVPMPDGQYAVYGLNERPTTEQTKVATVVVYKGGIEQIIFNIAHGLHDGVYELVKP